MLKKHGNSCCLYNGRVYIMKKHKSIVRKPVRQYNKDYDDIILAYEATESIPNPGLGSLGYPGTVNERMPGHQLSCIPKQQHYPYNGMMTETRVGVQDINTGVQQWNELVPIDEGPELIYASQKAMETRLNELRKKRPKFSLKSKGIDDLCISLKCAARGMKFKKKRRLSPVQGGSSGVNTSMESIESDNSGTADHQDQMSRIMYETNEDMYSLPEKENSNKTQILSQSSPAVYENVPIHMSTMSHAEGRAARTAMYEDAMKQGYGTAVPTYEDVSIDPRPEQSPYGGVILNHSSDVIAL